MPINLPRSTLFLGASFPHVFLFLFFLLLPHTWQSLNVVCQEVVESVQPCRFNDALAMNTILQCRSPASMFFLFPKVLKEENLNRERNAALDQNSKTVENESHVDMKCEINRAESDVNATEKSNASNHERTIDSQGASAAKNHNAKEFPSPSPISIVATRDAGSPSAVSPRRKQRPHPGPIIIPASVNNKVTHSVTFSNSTVKQVSPVKMGYHNPPIYTPPPMLSPRSIFFTGTTCATPRSAIPLTPGRLLLSARRLSTTAEGTKEEETDAVAIPEP